jgi:hypothetical protein
LGTLALEECDPFRKEKMKWKKAVHMEKWLD